MKNEKETSSFLVNQSLGSYFYEKLSFLNKKSLCPVPQELIYYSSQVLEGSLHSENFFDLSDGKVKDKVLGLRLLESKAKTKEEKKRSLKEIGDTSLLVAGYFSESLNKKLVDENYYREIGKMAYLELDAFMPNFLDVKSFYRSVATGFETLSRLLSLLAESQNRDPYEHLLLNELTSEDLYVRGITPNKTRKIS